MQQHFFHDPALPFVESRRAQHSRACYRAHSHPTLSIGAVDAGYSTLTVDGAAPLRLAPGDVVLIAPHRAHACNPDRGAAWSYQMLYLDPAWAHRLLSEEADDELASQWIAQPAARQDSYQQLCRLNQSLFSPLDINHKESLLVEYVGQCLCREPLALSAQPPSWLTHIQFLLEQQCHEVWPLAQLAAKVGLGRYHFIRAFRAFTGMTPHAFQLDCRINRARILLRTGCPAAELAQTLGFSDQSHFHHAFKQRVAVTPRQYARGEV